MLYPSASTRFSRLLPYNINVTANSARGVQDRGVTDMKTQARILVAVLSSLACFAYVNTIAASDQTASSQLSANKHRPPGDVYPSDIYDPLGLVAWGRHGRLVTLASGFSFTE